MRIATGETRAGSGPVTPLHPLSGAGEDRNERFAAAAEIIIRLHPLSGAGEDRNGEDAAQLVVGDGPLHPLSGAGEDRNLHDVEDADKLPEELHPLSGAGEDRNAGSGSTLVAARNAAPALRSG